MTDCSAGSIIQQAQCVLEPIANKLGQGAQYSWEVYYRQVIVDAAVNIVIASLVLIPLIVIAIWVVRTGMKEETWGDDISPGIFVALGGVLCVIVIPICFQTLIEGVKHLLNPGYYTIQEIVSSFKNLV